MVEIWGHGPLAPLATPMTVCASTRLRWGNSLRRTSPSNKNTVEV